MQKVLILSTKGNGLRSEAEGWSWEDGDSVFNQSVEVGYFGSGPIKYYKTPLHAIGDRWNLLAPPSEYMCEYGDDGKQTKMYEWWFVKS